MFLLKKTGFFVLAHLKAGGLLLYFFPVIASPNILHDHVALRQSGKVYIVIYMRGNLRAASYTAIF